MSVQYNIKTLGSDPSFNAYSYSVSVVFPTVI